MKYQINMDNMIKDYLELGSCYRVAEKYGIPSWTIKRRLKKAGALLSQSEAASKRNRRWNNGKYSRTPDHRAKLSEIAKGRTGAKNPFYGKTHSEATKALLSAAASERAGNRNPNYKHGNYKRRSRDYRISEFRPVRDAVFARDAYSCQYCKKVGGSLHAHHKIPYWVSKDAYLDIDNVITVCVTCHKKHAHLGDYARFDVSIISDELASKYSLDRERLSEMAAIKNSRMR